MLPFFYKVGDKVITGTYYNVFIEHILQWFKATYSNGNCMQIQDGDLGHTAKKVQKFCKDNFVDFCPAYFWPSFSPNPNPLDYAMWDILEQATNKTSYPNIDMLKTKHWRGMG